MLKQLVERAASHPKMEALLKVVLSHFKPQQGSAIAEACVASAEVVGGKPAEAADPAEPDQPGRVIIFTNRRDSVQSIVEMLRAHEPTVTAR